MYQKVWCTCNSVVLLIKPVCLFSFCFVLVVIVVFWRSCCCSGRQILRTLLPTPPHQAFSSVGSSCTGQISSPVTQLLTVLRVKKKFSRLDFCCPWVPSLILPVTALIPEQRLVIRPSLGQNKMEQQTPIPTPPPPVKDETSRRALTRRFSSLIFFWGGGGGGVWVFHLFWPPL